MQLQLVLVFKLLNGKSKEAMSSAQKRQLEQLHGLSNAEIHSFGREFEICRKCDDIWSLLGAVMADSGHSQAHDPLQECVSAPDVLKLSFLEKQISFTLLSKTVGKTVHR